MSDRAMGSLAQRPMIVLPLRMLLLLLAAFILVLLTPMIAQGAGQGGMTGVVIADSVPARAPVLADSASSQAEMLPPIVFHGEVRSRSEMDRLTSEEGSDAFTYLRSRFGALVEVGEGTRVRVTVQDSRILGADGRPSPASSGGLRLHEGYVELSRPWSGVDFEVRAGRQEIAFGNERLIGAVNWSNTGRTFDGLRLTTTPREGAAWSVSAFGAVMDERGRRFGAPGVARTDASDHVVLGAHATMGAASGVSPSAVLLDATIVHDMAADYRAYSDADRTTMDVRLRVPSLAGVRAEFEGAVQTGRQQWAPLGETQPVVRQDIRAWLLGARLGTAAPIGRLTSATVGVDVLSGDENASDGRYSAFTTPYATNHPFYGLMDVFLDPAARTRDRGLADAFVSVVVRLHPAVSLRSDFHRHALTTGDRDDLGWELDLVAPIRVTRNSALELGYGVYRATEKASPLALQSGEWGYAQLRAWF